MEIALLKYPKRSHRKPIKIPDESSLLAELMGIEFGDGAIGNPWQMVVTVNSKKDTEYAKHVVDLIRKLFGIEAVVRKRKDENTLQIISSSTSFVDFLTSKGATRGNKILQKIDMPQWIHKKISYKKAFIKGLVDTDGCLYIHRHIIKGITYKNIGFCFTSYSKNLLNSAKKVFEDFGFKPHIADKGRRIYLYSENSVKKYLRIFGSNNPRIINKYREWKGAGVV